MRVTDNVTAKSVVLIVNFGAIGGFCRDFLKRAMARKQSTLDTTGDVVVVTYLSWLEPFAQPGRVTESIRCEICRPYSGSTNK